MMAFGRPTLVGLNVEKVCLVFEVLATYLFWGLLECCKDNVGVARLLIFFLVFERVLCFCAT